MNQLTDGLSCQIALIRLTPTMITKSIIDARDIVRELLRASALHSFETQLQGEQYKRSLPTLFITEGCAIETMTSLYRPITKAGDPRIWIRGVSRYLEAGDLLVLGVSGGVLWATTLRQASSTRLARLPEFASATNLRHMELDSLTKRLIEVKDLGWVTTLRSGDTGVGFTLETLLGIAANSNSAPDYKGIELKASRIRSASSRGTLFSRIPDWQLSRAKNAHSLVDECGYTDRNGRPSLYCTVNSQPNPQGLHLKPEWETRRLYVMHHAKQLLCYPFAHLDESLTSKHQDTVFVGARARTSGEEEFYYCRAAYCRGASFTAFLQAIELGAVSLDLTCHIRANGTARDHGYLWRCRAGHVPNLFSYREILFDACSAGLG